MIGAFVQVNRDTPATHGILVGYVVTEAGCWEWVGSCSNGYGYWHDPVSRKKVRAHRYMYEQLRGPIPSGLTLDHLCRNKRCVRPEHLEVVSHRTNVLRGNAPAGLNSRKIVCPYGHELTTDYDGKRRVCKICRAYRAKRRRERRRVGALHQPLKVGGSTGR